MSNKEQGKKILKESKKKKLSLALRKNLMRRKQIHLDKKSDDIA